MKKVSTFETVEGIPDWAATYFANADDTALSEEDKQLADEYLARLEKDGLRLVCPVDGTENEFNHCPAFGLACSTQDWTAERIGEEAKS